MLGKLVVMLDIIVARCCRTSLLIENDVANVDSLGGNDAVLYLHFGST